MRAAPLKIAAVCALGAALGGASMQLLLQRELIAGSASGQAIVGPAESGRSDTAPPFEQGTGTGAVATRGQTEVEVRRDGVSPASKADAIARLAATDPSVAMERALVIEPYWLRRDTMERVAAVWAERAPNDVLAFVQADRELDPGIRSAVRSRALEVWAVTDPSRALAYLLGRDGQDLFFTDERTGRRFARELAARQPHELLYAANGLPKGIVRSELRTSAIASLVEEDLAFVLREAALAAPGLDRQQWVTAIHRAHPDRAEELGLCELDPGVC